MKIILKWAFAGVMVTFAIIYSIGSEILNKTKIKKNKHKSL